jgi:hypothetical protein
VAWAKGLFEASGKPKKGREKNENTGHKVERRAVGEVSVTIET